MVKTSITLLKQEVRKETPNRIKTEETIENERYIEELLAEGKKRSKLKLQNIHKN